MIRYKILGILGCILDFFIAVGLSIVERFEKNKKEETPVWDITDEIYRDDFEKIKKAK